MSCRLSGQDLSEPRCKNGKECYVQREQDVKIHAGEFYMQNGCRRMDVVESRTGEISLGV